MPAYSSRSNDKPRDHRPVFPPRDFREPLDHSDPRQRLSFKTDPPNWDRKHEPIPLSMRAAVPSRVLEKDDEIFGPPGNRKPGVIEYETKMGLPDGRVFMDTMTNDQLLHLIAEGLEPALPGIMSKLPESAQKADTKYGMRLLEESRRNDFLHQYPDGGQRRKRTSRPLEKKRPLRPEENNVQLKPYYTVHPKPAACEKCRAMADRIFPALPMIPHSNCRCEMREHIGNERRVVEGRSWVNLKKLRNSGFPEETMYADAENDTPADFVEMRKKGLPKGNREWTTFFEQVQDNALDQGASTVQAIESQIPGFAAKKRELEIISKREACKMTPPEFRPRCKKQLIEM